MEKFIVDGIYCNCNSSGFEIMLSECGSRAKVKEIINLNQFISGWLRIDLVFDSKEDEWFPYIDPFGYHIPLYNIMMYN